MQRTIKVKIIPITIKPVLINLLFDSSWFSSSSTISGFLFSIIDYLKYFFVKRKKVDNKIVLNTTLKIITKH